MLQRLPDFCLLFELRVFNMLMNFDASSCANTCLGLNGAYRWPCLARSFGQRRYQGVVTAWSWLRALGAVGPGNREKAGGNGGGGCPQGTRLRRRQGGLGSAERPAWPFATRSWPKPPAEGVATLEVPPLEVPAQLGQAQAEVWADQRGQAEASEVRADFPRRWT